MLLARFTSLCVLALSANAADGAVPSTSTLLAGFGQPRDPVEAALDRNVRMSEAFAASSAYTGSPVLEQRACAEFDKRRQLRGRLPSRLIQAASEQLNLPMGTGRFLAVAGQQYLFCLEPHYREPGTGRGPTGWHKGVTVYDAS